VWRTHGLIASLRFIDDDQRDLIDAAELLQRATKVWRRAHRVIDWTPDRILAVITSADSDAESDAVRPRRPVEAHGVILEQII
jgi:hypothetical protein